MSWTRYAALAVSLCIIIALVDEVFFHSHGVVSEKNVEMSLKESGALIDDHAYLSMNSWQTEVSQDHQYIVMRPKLSDSISSIAKNNDWKLPKEFTQYIKKQPRSLIANKLKNLHRHQSVVGLIKDGQIQIVRLETDDKFVLIDLTKAKLRTHSKNQHLGYTYKTQTIQIESSLIKDLKKAQVPQDVISQLVDLLSAEIDLSKDIQLNSKLNIFYRMKQDEDRLSDSRLLRMSYPSKNKLYSAYYFPHIDGIYVDGDGVSFSKSFMRHPLKFDRISSHFNLKRRHPVLKTVRAHKGVDYAAKRGTPIQAVCDGKVIFLGRKGGYGNTVELDHGRGITTLYAHLDKFPRGLKLGSKVKKNQLIGFVGATGLATGCHLHYEYRIKGQHVDPLKVKLPGPQKLTAFQYKSFLNQKKSIDDMEQLIGLSALTSQEWE